MLLKTTRMSTLLLFLCSFLLIDSIDAQFEDFGNMGQLIQSILSGKTTYTAREEKKKSVPVNVSPDVYGNWTYRSFMDHPDGGLSFDDLYFAVATLELTDSKSMGILQGRLIFAKNIGFMLLKGSIHYSYPFTLRFQGIGISHDIENHTYDYIGFMIPQWPHGSEQRPSIVGSVIRTLPHDGHPAGVVASFIAVKQNRN